MAVVVDGRLRVRLWSIEPRSWWRTPLEDQLGTVFVDRITRGFRVRALLVHSEKLKDLVSQAYKEKYNTRGSVGYVQDTTERVHLSDSQTQRANPHYITFSKQIVTSRWLLAAAGI